MRGVCRDWNDIFLSMIEGTFQYNITNYDKMIKIAQLPVRLRSLLNLTINFNKMTITQYNIDRSLDDIIQSVEIEIDYIPMQIPPQLRPSNLKSLRYICRYQTETDVIRQVQRIFTTEISNGLKVANFHFSCPSTITFSDYPAILQSTSINNIQVSGFRTRHTNVYLSGLVHLQNLQTLSLYFIAIHHDDFHHFTQNCNSVRTLNINRVTFGSTYSITHFFQDLSQMKSIQKLNFGNDPILVSLYSIFAIINALSSLTDLNINCTQDSDIDYQLLPPITNQSLQHLHFPRNRQSQKMMCECYRFWNVNSNLRELVILASNITYFQQQPTHSHLLCNTISFEIVSGDELEKLQSLNMPNLKTLSIYSYDSDLVLSNNHLGVLQKFIDDRCIENLDLNEITPDFNSFVEFLQSVTLKTINVILNINAFCNLTNSIATNYSLQSVKITLTQPYYVEYQTYLDSIISVLNNNHYIHTLTLPEPPSIYSIHMNDEQFSQMEECLKKNHQYIQYLSIFTKRSTYKKFDNLLDQLLIEH
ncbi:hypothetical protein DLAC_02782 [Tieghemostelium lacteum]|uniref:Uncharacterized protein n=1 Tax=Tieghemostelium lacteum TaxID=361077 RepID=A0A152A3F1_TIELA|nr:hypothetical protein DLAC_02782 [Tieghemostelium lacteum]|eukprot:KYR00740.1 hypothetical protein DLAC_02782 [Tieghemostelium lacteum]